MASEFVDTTLVDGFADGPHITEKQIGLANQGTYGPDDYVLETGRQAEAQILTNNSIRIFDAVYVIQGRRDVIAANDYTDVNIDNGAQGMNRNDIIVRRYEKDEGSEIESTSYAVIKGTPSSGTAADPDITEGNIRSGATLHEMKLYRVKLEGLNIVAVEPLFKVLMNMSTLNASLSELTNKIKIVDILKCDIRYGDDGVIEGNGYHTCIGTIKSDKKISDCKFAGFFVCSNFGVPMNDPVFLVRGNYDVTVQQQVQNYTDVDHTIITTLMVICYKD